MDPVWTAIVAGMLIIAGFVTICALLVGADTFLHRNRNRRSRP